MKRLPKGILLLLFGLFITHGLAAKPIGEELEGQYTDNTSQSITLVIEHVTDNEVLISDPQKVFITSPIRVNILEKKVNDLVGMKIANYVTNNKNIRFSEVNGVITLTIFTSDKAFVGKKKLTGNTPLSITNIFKQ